MAVKSHTRTIMPPVRGATRLFPYENPLPDDLKTRQIHPLNSTMTLFLLFFSAAGSRSSVQAQRSPLEGTRGGGDEPLSPQRTIVMPTDLCTDGTKRYAVIRQRLRGD
jgi:hypothetical protein